jgi:catechol 2,3-dioxygenase-like lactoylglutathione lyase family enzyme
MLKTAKAMATVAVKDLKTARAFYEGSLGLTPTGPQEPGTASYGSAGGPLFLYESQYAGSNKATAVTWDVGSQVEDLAQALKAKGVVFERYDMPDLTLRGDVYVNDHMKVAWFKDPDGNIHAIAGT